MRTSFERLSMFTVAAALTVLAGVSGCADMTARQKSTAVGAGVGAVAGSVITGGSVLGAGVGAAVGGVVGNEAGKK